MPRPSALPEVEDKLLQLISAGVGLKRACGAVGIGYSTLRLWRSRGEDAAALEAEGYELEESEVAYLRFLRRFTRAREALLTRVEVQISRRVDHADTSVRDLLEVACRLDPGRWSRNENVRVSHESVDSDPVHHRHGKQIAVLLRGIAQDLNLTEEQREQWQGIVETNLRQLTTTSESELPATPSARPR